MGWHAQRGKLHRLGQELSASALMIDRSARHGIWCTLRGLLTNDTSITPMMVLITQRIRGLHYVSETAWRLQLNQRR